MKKIYLKNLSKKDLKNIILNNENFMQMFGEKLFEDNMDMQEEESKNILGENFYNYIDVRDNYSSFYLRLKDSKKFIYNIDKDYLSPEQEELYNKCKKIVEDIENISFNEDDAEEKEDDFNNKLDNLSIELLESIEKDLHEYENYPSNDDILEFILENEFYLKYYTNEEKQKIFIDYTKEY